MNTKLKLLIFIGITLIFGTMAYYIHNLDILSLGIIPLSALTWTIYFNAIIKYEIKISGAFLPAYFTFLSFNHINLFSEYKDLSSALTIHLIMIVAFSFMLYSMHTPERNIK